MNHSNNNTKPSEKLGRVILGIDNQDMLPILSALAQTTDVRNVPVIGCKDVWFSGASELITVMNAAARVADLAQRGVALDQAVKKVMIETATSKPDAQEIMGVAYMVVSIPEGNPVTVVEGILAALRNNSPVTATRDLPEVWFPTFDKFLAFPSALHKIRTDPGSEQAMREALEFKLL